MSNFTDNLHHASMKHHFVETEKTRISVYEWRTQSRGLGPTVILVHATGFHGRCWDQVIEHLQGCHVLAIDARGHGRSDKTPFDDWTELGGDIAAVLNSMGISAAIGVGHSMGGFATLYSGVLDDSLYSEMFLIDPVILPPELYSRGDNPMAVPDGMEHPISKRQDRFDSIDDMVARLETTLPYSLFDEAVLLDYCRYGVVQDPNFDGYSLACPPDFEASVYQNALKYKEIYREIGNLPMPITIVRAMQPARPEDWKDFRFSPTWPKLSERLSKGRDIHLTSATHFLPMQEPKLVAELIREKTSLSDGSGT